MKLLEKDKKRFNEQLKRSQLRPTKQRETVYALVCTYENHLSADQIFALSKKILPNISLATVYNCLESLVECDLIREINFGRRPTRYETTLREHAHFYCNDRDELHDIELPKAIREQIISILPKGFNLETMNVKFTGTCDCHN